MRVTLAATVFLGVLLAGCSAASYVSSKATRSLTQPANVCSFQAPPRPFYAWRGWGYCPNPVVRT